MLKQISLIAATIALIYVGFPFSDNQQNQEIIVNQEENILQNNVIQDQELKSSKQFNKDVITKLMEQNNIQSREELLSEQEQEEHIIRLANSSEKTFNDLKNSMKNVCLNGKNPKKMTKVERLDEFIKGPCSPVMLLPGIMGTALQVEIDCETLQEEEPEIFQSCGWTKCHKPFYDVLGKIPKSEYRIWVGSLTSPDSVFTIVDDQSDDKAKCFGNLIQLSYVEETGEWNPPKGINVTVVGNTEGTKDNQCGNTAIGYLASDPINWAYCGFKGYTKLTELLNSMGYMQGVTYQSLPYDYRYNVEESHTTQKIKDSLINLKKFTGKTTIIISHSYGSLHTLTGLNSFTQTFKDQYIHEWIPTGGPLSGAQKAAKLLLNADEDFIVDLGHHFGKDLIAGIQFHAQRSMSESSPSGIDLLARDIMGRQEMREKPWMKEILQRIEYEKDENNKKYTQIPLDYFPIKEEICRPLEDDDFKRHCRTHLFDSEEDYFVQIEQDLYYLRDQEIKDMLRTYGTKKMQQQFEGKNTDVFDELKNPGVKVAVVYSAIEKVPIRFRYNENPRDYTSKEKFYFPDVMGYTMGDGTVTTTSALIAPIKWKWEHDQEMTDSKPVKFVEYCSSYNPTTNINENEQDDGSYSFNKSGYNGLECSCKPDNYSQCEHSCIIGEQKYIEFISNVISSQAVSEYIEIGIPQFFEEELVYYMEECPNIF